MLPLAIQLYSLREEAEKDYASVIRRVSQIGYIGVEPAGFPNITPEKAGSLYKEYNLKVPSAHMPLPLNEKKNEVLEAMEAIDCKRLVSGKGPDDFKTVDLVKKTCEIFNEVNSVCKDKGLKFGIHNHWWEFMKIDDTYVYELMLKYLDPDIEFQLDTYWIKTAGVDPVKVIRQLAKRVNSLHIKDGPCVKNEPMTAIGKGKMNFPPIIKEAEKSAEWLIVEIDRCKTDMTEAVTQSFNFLVNKKLGYGKSK